MSPHRRTAAVVSIFAVAGFLAARPAVPPPTSRSADAARQDPGGEPLPVGALSRAGTLRFRHGGEIGQIVFSPDGKSVYTACPQGNSSPAEKVARAWSVPDGRLLHKFGGDAFVMAVTVSADGKLVATGEADNVVRIWDAVSGKEIRRIQMTAEQPNRDPNQVDGPPLVAALNFGPDGKTIAVSYGQRGAAAVWDITTGAEVNTWSKDQYYPFFYSRDGKRFAAIGDGVLIVDTATGAEVKAIQHGTDPNSPTSIMGAVLNGDGTRLATSTQEQIIRFWDVDASKELWSVNVQGYANDLTISRDGSTLAANCHEEEGIKLRLFETATGKEIQKITRPANDVAALAFSPDGKTLASGGIGHTLQLWDIASGKPVEGPPGHPGSMTTIAVAPDGRLLATCSDRDPNIRIWDTATGREVRRLEGQKTGVDEVTISPDGKLLASAVRGGQVFLWEVATGRLVHKLGDDDAELGPYLRFSDDSKTLAIGGDGNSVELWDCTTGKQTREMPAPTNGLASMLTFHDGRLLAYEKPVPINDEGEAHICLWDVTANRIVRQFAGHPLGASSVILSNDGRMLASRGVDKTIRVWDVATGGERFRFQEPGSIDHLAGWTGTQFLAFAPDRRSLITAATDDPFARRWDLQTGKEMPPLTGHLSWVGAVEFSANGRVLVTGSQDTTSLVWDWTALKPRPIESVQRSDAEIAAWWNDLREADAAKTYQAILTLSAVGDQSVKAIAGRLRPAAPAEAARIKAWIGDLDHPRFAEREKATNSLVAVGGQAEEALRAARDKTRSAEVRQRIDRILDAGWDPAAWPDRLEELRAVEVLETLGTPVAREYLKKLGGGAAGATITREAQSALRRLGEFAGAPSAPR
jgi:WD40 repeat protein